MKKLIYIACCQSLLLLGLVGCSKYHDTPHDLSGNNYIAGTVYLVNDYSADGTMTPLGNHPVMVTDASLTVPNFLFSPNLRNGVMYTIFSYDTIGGIVFSDTVQRMLTNDETPIQNVLLNLTVDQTMQNGFIFTVMDNQGNVVPGDTVLIYSSSVLAAGAGAADTCEGCNLQLVTNALGKVSAFNLAPGPYTAYFTLELNNGATILTATYTFQLGAIQVVTEPITVQ